MKHLFSVRFLSLLTGAVLTLPSLSQARDVKVRRDLDGDGHYNTKHVEVRGHYDHGRYYGGSYGRGYYGYPSGGYGYGYGYGYPYGYNYGSPYRYGYSDYGYRSYGTYYGRPAYSDRYADDLAVGVQRSLARRGYYHGAIDGDIGPGSRAAIRSYQANHRLAVTGRVDGSLVRSLGLD